MLVRDHMNPYPRTLKPSSTLKDAARLFFTYRISGAPVLTESGEICGLITSAHLIEAIINDVSFSTPVKQVMTYNVITVSPENALEEAWQIPVSRLPVVSADNKVVGILTRRDFLNAFYTQMRQAKDEVEALIRSAHNGIIVVNAYGIITTFNEAAAKLIGVELSDALGKHVADIIPGTGLLRVLSTGRVEMGCELTINGQTVFSNRSPICEGPKIVGAVALLQDTSELLHITRELESSQHHIEALENIFECAPQGIVVVDKGGIISKVNRAYEEVYGVLREELLGRRASDVIENTRLPIVLQTGVPEIADVQEHKGRPMIVSRVPLFKDGEIIGAMGEAIFKDAQEISRIWERLASCHKKTGISASGQKGEAAAEVTIENICGRSRVIVEAKNLARKAAAAESNVLIIGESGTGKELFAQAIHNGSRRRGGPFIAINCSAIPSELLEAELFGYEEGAFTGARRGGKKGKFQLAHTGTLFLDEIGDMPLLMQSKLLRVIEDRKVETVGGMQAIPVDVRLIAATNQPLYKMVLAKTFRDDLYYRLNVISLQVPPLRERREDIGELVSLLADRVSKKLGRQAKSFAPETLALLREGQWPGNVRELINLLEQVTATVDSAVILPKHLPVAGGQGSDRQESRRVAEALQQAGGNKALAAKLLGIHRSTLYEKLKKYHMEVD